VFGLQSFVTDTVSQSFCHSFIALSMIVRRSTSDQKSAVQVYQVATVVIKATQLVLSQCKKNFIVVNAELNKVFTRQK